MKFYYNGRLVRTSKTHEYKFAAINTARFEENPKAGVLKCSATYEGAYQVITTSINQSKENIKFYSNMLEEIKNGKTKMYCATAYKHYIDLTRYTIEELEEYIEAEKKFLASVGTDLKVVELEARD